MNFAIVSMRYFGDCLIAASLSKTLKSRFPESQVAVLTFKRNIPILEGIPSIDERIAVADHAALPVVLTEIQRLWNKFDWAIGTTSSTRSLAYTAGIGKQQTFFRIGGGYRSFWKHLLISNEIPEPQGHVLDRMGALLQPFAGKDCFVEPVAPYAPLPTQLAEHLAERPYVVLHTSSQFSDKDWPLNGWRTIASRLIENGYRIAFTGGNAQKEKEKIEQIANGFNPKTVVKLAGKLTFGQTSALIQHAKAYVGVDTSTSHIAGATGTPSIILFGHSPIEKWGPAPKNGARNWSTALPLQRSGNVSLIRNARFINCQKCRSRKEGICPHSSDPQLAECLQTLPIDAVWNELDFRLHPKNGKN